MKAIHNIGAGIALSLGLLPALLPTAHAQLQPNARANGESLAIHYIGGSTANWPAIIAEKKGFCEAHGFKCETKAINSAPLALQALLGKSVDVALAGTDTAAANVAKGGDLAIVATLVQNNPFAVVAGADTPVPNKAKGYPAVMQDFKGKRVGVGARGSASETAVIALLKGAGLDPKDVTFVPVGGPATAYQALTVGKQVDFLAIFTPIPTMCVVNKACDVIVDLTTGTVGPKSITDMNGAMISLLMRRDMVDSNPQLARAYVAAMSDAVKWARTPANFEEVVKIFEPIVSFGSAPNANELRRAVLRNDLATVSPGMETSRQALKAVVEFAVQTGVLDKPIDPQKMIWKEAP